MTKVLKFIPKRSYPGDVDTNAKDCWRHCRQVLLDAEERTLKCKDCGRLIDPFDYLAAESKMQKNMWERAADELNVLYKEIGEKKDELESLKRKVRYQKNGKA